MRRCAWARSVDRCAVNWRAVGGRLSVYAVARSVGHYFTLRKIPFRGGGIMNLSYKTRGGENARDLYRIYVCAHPTDYSDFVKGIIPEIHENQNCAIFYKDDPSVITDEDTLSEFNLFIVLVTRRFLCEENIARDVELSMAKKLHLTILPIIDAPNLDMEYAEHFGDLQYLARFSVGGGAIDYKEKLQLYLSEHIIPTPLIERIKNSFAATFFLSYRKKDRVTAQNIIRIIHEGEDFRRVAVWYDEYLTPGEDFNSSIADAIDKSVVFLLAVTKNLVGEDNYVSLCEYPMAKEKNITLIPIILEEVEEKLLHGRFPDLPPCIPVEDTEAILKRIGDALCENGMADRITDCPDHVIALAYFMGIYLERNTDIAISIFKRCAENGSAEALEILSDIYSNGERVEPDIPLAIKYHKQLTKIKKREYMLSGISVTLRDYMLSLVGLLRLYMKNGEFVKASGVAKKLDALNSNCPIREYRVCIFEDILSLYEFSGDATCLERAAGFIHRGDLYPIATLMERLIDVSDGRVKIERAEDYYDFLSSLYNDTEFRTPYIGGIINRIAEKYLPKRERVQIENDPFTMIEEPLSREETDGKPLSREATDSEPLSREATDSKPLSREATDSEPLSIEATDSEPLSTEASRYNDKNARLLFAMIPDFARTCMDETRILFVPLYEWVRGNIISRVRGYSPDTDDNNIEKAEVFSRRLCARDIYNLSSDYDYSCIKWFERATLSYSNETEAKRLATIYERIVGVMFANISHLGKGLLEVYDYLSQREPYNYTWLQKYSHIQLSISRNRLLYADHTSAMESARTTYGKMKNYATVNTREDHHFELAAAAVSVGVAELIGGNKESAVEYFSEALDELLHTFNRRELTAKRQRIELNILSAPTKGEEGFELLKKTVELTNAIPCGEERDLCLAKVWEAYRDMHKSMGAHGEELYYSIRTVDHYKKMADEYGEGYKYALANSICSYAEALYKNDRKAEIPPLYNEIESIINGIEEQTYLGGFILSRIDSLCGWLMKENGEYAAAIERLENAVLRLEKIGSVKEKSAVYSIMHSCYKGIYHSHLSLGERDKAQKVMKRVLKLGFKTGVKDIKSSLIGS